MTSKVRGPRISQWDEHFLHFVSIIAGNLLWRHLCVVSPYSFRGAYPSERLLNPGSLADSQGLGTQRCTMGAYICQQVGIIDANALVICHY